VTKEYFIARRKALGYTPSKLANRLGVNRTTVWRYETGRRSIPEPMARLLMNIRSYAGRRRKEVTSGE